MKETIVINIDRTLLHKIMHLAEKRKIDLSRLISFFIEQGINYDNAEIDCSRSPDDGICLESLPKDAKLYTTLEAYEKKMIKRALYLSNDVQAEAAKLLGMSRSNLNNKIQKLRSNLNNKIQKRRSRYGLSDGNISLDNYKEIEKLLEYGYSKAFIAKKYGVSEGQLLWWLNKIKT